MAHKHKLNTFHLFAGAGGGILADLLLGHNPIGACEIEPYPRDVLLARQRDGILPNFPIWDDVCTLDGTPWRGTVDVLCGGFPCQDISAAGKGAGISGERSGLWKEYARLIGEMRPRFVFAENSPLLRTRGLGVVLEDLAALGYNARWGVLGARDVGAPHKRDRMWVLADSNGSRSRQDSSTGELRTSRIEQPSEDTGLSNDREVAEGQEGLRWWNTDPAEVAHASEQGLQGHDQQQAKQTEASHGRGSEEHTKRSGLWWHTDPANLSNTEGWRGRKVPIYREEAWSREGEDAQCMGNSPVYTQHREQAFEPIVGRVAHGVARRVDRLKAIGNGQVPQCAALAFSILSEGLTSRLVTNA